MNIRKPILFGILILTAAVITMGGTYQSGQDKKKPQLSDEKEISDALSRGGYREAARLKGHVVTQVDPTWDWAGFDLETLTKSSAAVVVGEAGEGKGQLSHDGRLVTTDYDVMVTKPLKGNFREGNIIKVSMLGGNITFEDGTSAEVQTPDFEKMVTGRKYLLFLTPNRNSPVLVLTGGPQGLFEIAEGKVKPFGRSTDAVSKQASKKTSEDLLREIQQYADKWPSSQGCCQK